jgi:hypothetical protein
MERLARFCFFMMGLVLGVLLMGVIYELSPPATIASQIIVEHDNSAARLCRQNNEALELARQLLEQTRVSYPATKETIVEQLAEYQINLQHLIEVLEEF